ncbi:MAG: dienelactone hydrolase family protein [Parachlamydia sp.]|jgi:putative phosphoribosyl transferase|nr:dienelactone hydrolase family protein [Parachlamydia sp.]
METLLQIRHEAGFLEGMLKIPANAKGLVLFAHGSGSSRFSPRNNFVADQLNRGGMGTLLIDLLSPEEDLNYQTRFDIPLLAHRLKIVIRWLQEDEKTQGRALGLFGSSTGAAAALEAAAALGEEIRAVVSRGGRPDLSLPALPQVKAPTLLIVGGKDSVVIELNQMAFQKLICPKEFKIIPLATHLFEEPGCLGEVAHLAKNWFNHYLNEDTHA